MPRRMRAPVSDARRSSTDSARVCERHAAHRIHGVIPGRGDVQSEQSPRREARPIRSDRCAGNRQAAGSVEPRHHRPRPRIAVPGPARDERRRHADPGIVPSRVAIPGSTRCSCEISGAATARRGRRTASSEPRRHTEQSQPSATCIERQCRGIGDRGRLRGDHSAGTSSSSITTLRGGLVGHGSTVASSGRPGATRTSLHILCRTCCVCVGLCCSVWEFDGGIRHVRNGAPGAHRAAAARRGPRQRHRPRPSLRRSRPRPSAATSTSSSASALCAASTAERSPATATARPSPRSRSAARGAAMPKRRSPAARSMSSPTDSAVRSSSTPAPRPPPSPPSCPTVSSSPAGGPRSSPTPCHSPTPSPVPRTPIAHRDRRAGARPTAAAVGRRHRARDRATAPRRRVPRHQRHLGGLRTEHARSRTRPPSSPRSSARAPGRRRRRRRQARPRAAGALRAARTTSTCS